MLEKTDNRRKQDFFGILGLANRVKPTVKFVSVQKIFQQDEYHHCDRSFLNEPLEDVTKHECASKFDWKLLYFTIYCITLKGVISCP